jgi:hypothetical protein
VNQLQIDFTVSRAQFDGSTYDPDQDFIRLNTQLRDVRDLMRDGTWRSLNTIAHATGYPEASVSARLRDLRKVKFGGYSVIRRRAQEGTGTFEYRVVV